MVSRSLDMSKIASSPQNHHAVIRSSVSGGSVIAALYMSLNLRAPRTMSSSSDPAHENRLARETSPYLLQHKHNPVAWWPWGPDALAEAQRANKPILLSVGYAACHWCHVMAHESFEDEATAAVMNELFVNIKVDREERPDIDQIYMNALHLLGEQGGWPLTMFLTPAGEPVWGGTYFPKQARYRRAAFRSQSDLHERAASVGRAGRLAAHDVPDAGGRAGVGRHVFPETSALRPRRVHRRAGRDRAAVSRRAGSHLKDPLRADGAARREGAAGRQGGGRARRARPRGERRRACDRHAAWRLARRAEVSPMRAVRVAVARGRASAGGGGRDAHRRAGLFLARAALARAHLRGRHLRSPRRRFLALFGRRALARAALREDAVRQRAAPGAAGARPCAHRAPAVPRARGRNRRLACARDDDGRGRVLGLARCGFGGRGGEVLCLVAGRDRAGARGAGCDVFCSAI